MLITSNPALLSIGIGVWGWFILEKVAMDEDAEKWVVHSDDGWLGLLVLLDVDHGDILYLEWLVALCIISNWVVVDHFHSGLSHLLVVKHPLFQ